jgi:hypothetical protein
MFGPPDHRVLDRTLPDQLLVTDSPVRYCPTAPGMSRGALNPCTAAAS